MALIIEDRRHATEFYTGTTPHLQGNILWKITTEIDIRIENWVDATVDNRVTFGVDGYLTNDYLKSIDTAAFTDFKVGMSIRAVNAASGSNNGTYTIIEKLSNSLIRLNSTLTTSTDDAVDLIQVDTIKGVKFFANSIPNDAVANFESFTTGETISYSINTALSTNVTPQNMIADGQKSAQFGSCAIKGRGNLTTSGVAYSQRFTITHVHYITPFGLPIDFEDLQDGIAPDYFKNDQALKYVFKIDAGPDLLDKTRIITVTDSAIQGITGWYRENFNGVPTNYSISNVIISRLSGGSLDNVQIIPQADDETVVTFTVTNTVDAPFVNESASPTFGTKGVISFNILPDDPANYIGNGKKMDQNYLFDRALLTVNSSPTPINGDQFVTARQVIKSAKATFVSATKINVELKTAFAYEIFDDLEPRDSRRYALSFQVADKQTNQTNSDGCTLPVKIGELFLDREIEGVISFTQGYAEHYTNDIEENTGSLKAIIEDEVVSRVLMTLDKSVAVDARLRDFEYSIVAKTTGKKFTLERFKFAFDDNNLINDIQFIDFSQNRPFPVLSTEIRKNIKLFRRIDLDTANTFVYELNYPWIHRFEDWVALANVDGFFFDQSHQNNGLNQNWAKYQTGPWVIQSEVSQVVRHSGINQLFEQVNTITSYAYDEDPDWENESIISIDTDTLVPIESGGIKYLTGEKNVLIRADFEKISGVIPAVGNVWMKFYLYVKNEGTYTKHSSASSVFDRSTVGAFSGLINVTNPSGTIFRGEVEINTNKIDLTKPNWVITARIGVKP